MKWHPIKTLDMPNPPKLSGGRSVALIALAASTLLGSLVSAHASGTINISQSGSDVVASGTGSFDTAELTYISIPGGYAPGVEADVGFVLLSDTPGYTYKGTSVAIAGPANFGSGSWLPYSSGSGDAFGIWGTNQDNSNNPSLLLPSGYISGTSLSGNSTWLGQSIISLGLNPGTYTWTWGAGAHADSLTVNISGVPEPSTFAIVVFGAVGLFFILRRKAAHKRA